MAVLSLNAVAGTLTEERIKIQCPLTEQGVGTTRCGHSLVSLVPPEVRL